MNGQRRYDGEVLELLAVVRVAQQARFTVAEIRTLLHGFSTDTPPSARWRALASRKLPEVAALIQRALGMKRLLERRLRCDWAGSDSLPVTKDRESPYCSRGCSKRPRSTW